jgi:ABC-type microcin C transport system permease subunit YejB
MLRFIARRLVLLIPVAIGILLVTFIIVHRGARHGGKMLCLP